MPRILGVANQKGGVGKTTTAVNLAACLAARGQAVLLIDLDPQANATTYLGLDPDKVQSSIHNALTDPSLPLEKILQETQWPGLVIAPADITLAKTEMALQTTVSRETLLKRKLSRLTTRFDWIVLDSPPHLGVLTYNAMVAAQRLLIPVQTEFFSLKGMAQLFEEIDLVRESLNSNLSPPWILPTMLDKRIHLNRDVVDFVSRRYAANLLKSRISRRSALVESSSYREPIHHFRPKSDSASEFAALAQEVQDLWPAAAKPVSTQNP